ncbi:Adenine DNA glycosylase [Fundidesulfovibrio magnetotacticus]|uniref:Adenine DNA glycosylase n=1 Tax=Fundidesulfovibrio magnetotacticus TaxID=2730080 RepID=A0A6V8LLK1_9BACT|nr:A/G-specific adenine glycosylase [Fundidesulfovibrio magnetotacticus]GFK92584.1 Adenine DNA glycosylase [Fundidesulfovibrio magnetotacticus]
MVHDPRLSAPLLHWFAASRRALPWRDGHDPYRVWLSEVMLQQTQMERGVDYFLRFTRRFPDLASLAAADEAEVLRLWEGLGYYRRARNLHLAARLMVERHGGRVPDDREALRALPGVGDYTAGAVLAIAYNRDEPAVDANAERVLARLHDVADSPRDAKGRRLFRELALGITPPGRAREAVQAVMELGALVCTPRAPRCEACPLSGECRALAAGVVLERPVLPGQARVTPIGMGTAVIRHRGLVFVQRRLDRGVWGGLWEFPGGQMEPGEHPRDTARREVREETGFEVEIRDKLAVIRHAYTRYRVTMHAFLAGFPEDSDPPEPVLTAAQEWRWTSLEGLAGLTLPAPMRELAQAMARDPRFAG